MEGSEIMFTFFAVLTIISLIGMIISFIMLILKREPFDLWIILICVCGVLLFSAGAISEEALSEENKDSTTPIIQGEQVKENHQYNYCPYCGKEIK